MAQLAEEFHLAVQIWREIIKHQDNWEHGNAHYNLGNCYFRLGKLDEAETEYGRAMKLEPENDMFSQAFESLRDARARGSV